MSTQKKSASKTAVVGSKTIARNKRARFDYILEDTIEAGIVLVGTEVKSLRLGKASINEAYASAENDSIYLINATIQEYPNASQYNHDPTRPRKLLLKAREYKKLVGAIQRKGMTLVTMSLYFNSRGIVKCGIALGKGKQLHDKRATEKDRDWQKQKSRLLKTQD